MKLSHQKLTLEQSLLAMILDELHFQSWTHSKDAQKGRPYKEKSVYKSLMGEYKAEKDDLETFSTVEQYEAYMSRFNEE